MRRRFSLGYLATALALVACVDRQGCGGATCPFGDVAFAAVEGRVFKADGSPYLGQEVFLSVGPGTYGPLQSPTDAFGRYRITIDSPADPGGETMTVRVTASPAAIEANVAIAFSRKRSTRPTTIIDLHER